MSQDAVLLYIDTSTSFVRLNGVEQLNAEVFLRSAPPYLAWILRILFLQDVVARYYDARKVTIDLIANFYKEQRPELLPQLPERLLDGLEPALRAGAQGGQVLPEDRAEGIMRSSKPAWRVAWQTMRSTGPILSLVRRV